MMIEPELVWLRRLVGAGGAVLMAVTWPLWGSPPDASHPQIPWFSVLCGVPFGVDVAALAVAGLGMLGMLAGPASSRWTTISCGLFFLGGLLLALLDQHRLQPWMWHLLIIAALLMLAPNRVGLTCCRWVVISIYVHSALSKLDLSFFQAHGQLLLEGLLKPTGIEVGFWPPTVKTVLAAAFPAGELAVGLLLLIRRARRWGLIGSIVMHLLLLSTLGPWGLNHEPGVLIWNVLFIVQNLILFRGRTDAACVPTGLSPNCKEPGEYAAVALAAIVILGPLLENAGRWDHWPAWAVYSPRPTRVQVLIDADSAAGLPPSLVPFLGRPAPLEDRVPLRLDAWSFTTRHCPVYPQLRYRIALARALLQGHVPGEAVTLVIDLTPRRLTGKRERIVLSGLDDVEEFRQRFWFNTEPRTPTPIHD